MTAPTRFAAAWATTGSKAAQGRTIRTEAGRGYGVVPGFVRRSDGDLGGRRCGDGGGERLRGFERIAGPEHADVPTDDMGSNVVNGDGGDRLEGGSGADVLTGGAGDDLFRFASGDGADAIVDFADGEDRIDLRGHTGVGSFGDLTIRQSSSGDAVIDLGGGDQLTLTGVQVSTLDASDFLF